MQEKPAIHFIPPKPQKRDKRVGIYCRGSTNSTDQLRSLSAQVSALTRLTAATPQWLLVDVYMDMHMIRKATSSLMLQRLRM